MMISCWILLHIHTQIHSLAVIGDKVKTTVSPISQFVNYTVLNLDVNFLTIAISCTHVKPITFGSKLFRLLRIFEKLGSTTFILLESHWSLRDISKWGILISVS